MPFDSAFDDIYHAAIKPACRDAGAYCERVDEQIFNESILERVYNQIAKADLVIAEMTGRNPNVFYETGYAHALNQDVILLTQHTDDIPFDLKQYPHIVYGGKIAYLKAELEKRVRWFVENPQDTQAQKNIETVFEFTIHSVSVKNKPTIELPWRFAHQVTSKKGVAAKKKSRPIEFSITLNLHNISTYRILTMDRYGYALVTPEIFSEPALTLRHGDRVILSPGIARTKIDINKIVFPDDWIGESVKFGAAKPFAAEASFDCALLVYSAVERYEYPFVVKFAPNPLASD